MAAGWNGWRDAQARYFQSMRAARTELDIRLAESRMAIRAHVWQQEQRRLWGIRAGLAVAALGVLICALF